MVQGLQAAIIPRRHQSRISHSSSSTLLHDLSRWCDGVVNVCAAVRAMARRCVKLTRWSAWIACEHASSQGPPGSAV